MKNLRFCKDCFYIDGIFCKRTKSVVKGYTDLVTGEVHSDSTMLQLCITERMWFPFSRRCGERGRYWERKVG